MSKSSNHALDRRSLISWLVNGSVDAPATSPACTLYYLIKHPATLEKLREELDSALSPTDSVAPWSKARNLTYLRACVNESMRRSPQWLQISSAAHHTKGPKSMVKRSPAIQQYPSRHAPRIATPWYFPTLRHSGPNVGWPRATID